MKNLNPILLQLQFDISTDLPALLTAAGLAQFVRYEVDSSRNPEEISFFIYQDSSGYMLDENEVSIIFQLQLYQIEVLEAAKYQDVIINYLRAYNPVNLGCILLRNLQADTWPIENTTGNFVFVVANWMEELDGCDN